MLYSSILHFNTVQHQSLLIVVSLVFCQCPVSSENLAVIRKTDLTKKMETQTQSPSKRSVIKPAVRQTRPTQHHSCPRRRPTGDTFPWSVTQLVLNAGASPQNQFPSHLTSSVMFSLMLPSIFLLVAVVSFVMCVYLYSTQ